MTRPDDAVRGRWRTLAKLVRRSSAERELAEELSHHVELEIEANVRRGMSPAEARRAAHVAFGGVERYTEQVRQARWTHWLEESIRDTRYALRSLRRTPAFALTAILTLALGIGANAALFGVVDALLWRTPSGVPPSDRLVWVENSGRIARLSLGDFRDLAETAGSADRAGSTEGALSLAGWQSAAVALGGAGEPARGIAQLVSGNFFEVIGATPARGRLLGATDDAVPGRDAVAVISHRLWEERFSASDDAIGATLRINGHPFAVAGVAPPRFSGLDIEEAADVWLPLMAQPLVMPKWPLEDRRVPAVRGVARLAAGISPAAAGAALDAAAARLPEADRFEAVRPRVAPLRGWIRPAALGTESPLLWFATILTGLVLLVCCTNLANLQLSRALGRRREVAVRLALGAGRGRLVRLLVTEALLLALLAGAAGTLIAFWITRALQLRFGGPLAALDLAPDGSTLLFGLGVALLAGLLSGLAPALHAARPDVLPTLKGDAAPWLRRGRGPGVLVAGQVALSLVLLAAAALFVARLGELRRVDPGFDATRVAALRLDLRGEPLEGAEREHFLQQLRQRLERIPGVRAVAIPTGVPLSGDVALIGVSPADAGTPPAAASDALDTTIRRDEARQILGGMASAVSLGVAANFFDVLDVRQVRGRGFLDSDFVTGAENVVIISEALAATLWPGQDPIGREVRATETTLRVVGTVPALAIGHIAQPEPLQLYRPHPAHFQFGDHGILVRFDGTAPDVLPRLRAATRGFAPDVPIIDLYVVERRILEQLGTQRALTGVIAAFGGVALLLCLIGLSGVVASAVAARRREIGVRLALGARPADVSRLFVRAGLRLALAGAAVGILLAAGVGRLISTIVWGVRPFEPVALGMACAALLTTAALAAWIPARRAAAVDPVRTLREE